MTRDFHEPPVCPQDKKKWDHVPSVVSAETRPEAKRQTIEIHGGRKVGVGDKVWMRHDDRTNWREVDITAFFTRNDGTFCVEISSSNGFQCHGVVDNEDVWKKWRVEDPTFGSKLDFVLRACFGPTWLNPECQPNDMATVLQRAADYFLESVER